MSKRDDDSQADMEVGMTTAERRRRRRRGGGLRVPSDNVPRRTTPPVVAPVPEDPSLAMSIAYSFSNDASEPVPRVTVETPVPSHVIADPVAPDAMPTVIDPPSAHVESADFEMKTREMSAVDLASLGLEDPNPSSNHSSPHHAVTTPMPRISSPNIDSDWGDSGPAKKPPLEVDVDVEPTNIVEPPKPPVRDRMRTVALGDEDLEEVRAQTRADAASTNNGAAAKPHTTTPPPMPPASAASASSAERTQPLNPRDIEALKSSEEPMSVPEIDINELAERASESSGEFEVDVDDDDVKPKAAAAAADADNKRARPSSVPPPIAPSATTTNPGVPPPPSSHHAHPPPPPPAAHHHKPPPAPPPAKKPAAPPAAASGGTATKSDAKLDPKPSGRKPWFVDLFDEDYLRTLPFLTPQATQAEAEFVIDAMGLAPGAQVLDVGCGYGRHAMELAARGYHVVGLDLSTPLLVRGGEEANRRGLQINFIRGDMRELDFEAQFDGAYCLFSTFGYFDDETNKKTITNIARALKPGGRVMLEILNRDYVIADLPTRVWWEGEGCVVLEEVELNYFSSRIQVNRSVVFDDGRQLEQEISVRAYSLHEVGKLMHAAGFRVLEVSGGYQTRGRFFGNQSRHIIVLAERKDTPAT